MNIYAIRTINFFYITTDANRNREKNIRRVTSRHITESNGFDSAELESDKIGGGFQSLIIKNSISSIVIGLKNSYFPLIYPPSCYRTVCYETVCYRTARYRTVQQANHIQSCSLNQPISISEQHETIYPSFVSVLMQIFPFFYNLATLLFSEIAVFMINW